MPVNVQKLVKDIESVVQRAEVLLLEQRVIDITERIESVELIQEGTLVIESILGYQIE